MKTNELSSVALDWAIAKLYFPEPEYDQDDWLVYLTDGSSDDNWVFSPSTDWSQGGPIIEQERIWIQPEIGKEGANNAWYAVTLYGTDAYGPTPLVAAMRCYAVSKLGIEVNLPE